MCTPSNRLFFCTCAPAPAPVVHNKNSRRAKKQAQQTATESDGVLCWSLWRKLGKMELSMEGLLMEPQHALRGQPQLSAEDVLLLLNDEAHWAALFDFDYTPQQDDALVIWRRADMGDRLQFVYQAGKWYRDVLGFGIITEKLNEGELRVTSEL